MTGKGRPLTVVVCTPPDGVIFGAFELEGATLSTVKAELTRRGYWEAGRIAVVRRPRGRVPVARYIATDLDGRRLWVRREAAPMTRRQGMRETMRATSLGLELEWTLYPDGWYALLEGSLLYAPEIVAGGFDPEDVGEVAFGLIDEEDAAKCRAIALELEGRLR